MATSQNSRTTTSWNTGAPPPPPRSATRTTTYSAADIDDLIIVIRQDGYVAIPADSRDEARNASDVLAAAIMRSPNWTSVFGEHYPRWVSRRSALVDGAWWGYAQVDTGHFVGMQNGQPVMCNADGTRARRKRAA